MKQHIIFIPKRKGHHKDYGSFLKKVLAKEIPVVQSFWSKLTFLFKKNYSIIYLDIDKSDIKFALVRSLLDVEDYGISVRGEEFLSKRNLWSLLTQRGRVRFVKRYIKKILFLIIKKRKKTQLISIHKDTEYEKELVPYFDHITYDFQYYDLAYIDFSKEKPAEVVQFEASSTQNLPKVLIFVGADKDRRNFGQLIKYIQRTKKFQFIIVGNIKLPQSQNIVHILRYVSNEELFFLMDYCEIVYCFYNNNRPSGFMGRAMQFNKYVIVPKGSYLGSIPYDKSIRISTLEDLEKISFSPNHSQINNNKFDNSEYLLSILNGKKRS